MKHKIVFPFRSKPKQRPRMSKKSRRAYTPQETKDFERRVADHYIAEGAPQFDTPVHLEVVFTKDTMEVTISSLPNSKTTIRSDIDNALKSLMDGLQLGGAFTNDRLVHSVKAVKK